MARKRINYGKSRGRKFRDKLKDVTTRSIQEKQTRSIKKKLKKGDIDLSKYAPQLSDTHQGGFKGSRKQLKKLSKDIQKQDRIEEKNLVDAARKKYRDAGGGSLAYVRGYDFDKHKKSKNPEVVKKNLQRFLDKADRKTKELNEQSKVKVQKSDQVESVKPKSQKNSGGSGLPSAEEVKRKQGEMKKFREESKRKDETTARGKANISAARQAKPGEAYTRINPDGTTKKVVKIDPSKKNQGKVAKKPVAKAVKTSDQDKLSKTPTQTKSKSEANSSAKTKPSSYSTSGAVKSKATMKNVESKKTDPVKSETKKGPSVMDKVKTKLQEGDEALRNLPDTISRGVSRARKYFGFEHGGRINKLKKKAKHGGALAIMIAPVKTKKMKAVKKADNGASTDPVKKKKASYKKATLKKLSGREKRISRNTEFNEYARKKGIIPNFYKIPYGEPGYEDQKERMKKFYSNKENLKMIEREQDKYFKNKEMKPVKKGAHGAKVKEAMYGAKMKKAMYGAKMKKAEMGAKLKEVPSDNKGLSKLPKKVRNKMGYMKNGGKLKRKKRNKIKMSREEFVAKQREISMRNELKENSKNPDSKKRADARTQNQLDRAMRANQIKKTKDKAGKGGYDKMMYGGAMKKAMYGAKMKKKAMYGAKMKK